MSKKDKAYKKSRSYCYRMAKEEFEKLARKYKACGAFTAAEKSNCMGLLKDCILTARNDFEENMLTKVYKQGWDIKQSDDTPVAGLYASNVADFLAVFLNQAAKPEPTDAPDIRTGNKHQVTYEKTKSEYVAVQRRIICDIKDDCKDGKISSRGDTFLYYYCILYARATINAVSVTLCNEVINNPNNTLVIPAFATKDHREGLDELLLPDVHYKRYKPEEKLKEMRNILDKLKKHNLIKYNKEREESPGNPYFTITIQEGYINRNAKGSYIRAGYILVKNSILWRLLRTNGKDYKVSEADTILDIWTNTITVDPLVAGSCMTPVYCFHTEKRNKDYYAHKVIDPRCSMEELAARWHQTRSSANRRVIKLAELGYFNHYYTGGADRMQKCGHLLVPRNFIEYNFTGTKTITINEDGIPVPKQMVYFPVLSPRSLSVIIDLSLYGDEFHVREFKEALEKAAGMSYRGKPARFYDVNFLNNTLVERFDPDNKEWNIEDYLITMTEIKENAEVKEDLSHIQSDENLVAAFASALLELINNKHLPLNEVVDELNDSISQCKEREENPVQGVTKESSSVKTATQSSKNVFTVPVVRDLDDSGYNILLMSRYDGYIARDIHSFLYAASEEHFTYDALTPDMTQEIGSEYTKDPSADDTSSDYRHEETSQSIHREKDVGGEGGSG